MSAKPLWIVGLSCLAAGALGGWLAASGRTAPGASAPSAPATPPTDSPSGFFKNFDPMPLAEAVSGRSQKGQEIVSASDSVTGGGLRWGERSFTACWEGRGEPKAKVAESLESQLDAALAAANMTCANPMAGQWRTSSDKLGSVYLVERRYAGSGRSGRLRAWLTMGEPNGRVALIITVDEPF